MVRVTATLLCLFFSCSPVFAQSWQSTLEEVQKSIVRLKVDQQFAFEGQWNNSGEATGFIVDSEQGIILTNRHVVTLAPVHARAVFSTKDEIELKALYRDPIHDFGFFKYDPSKLEGRALPALKLNPDAARPGLEIRVLGNDNREELSILPGILARLDRAAPRYARGTYFDFNTFYLQAATNTSGGSSGSPVINQKGEVVALNAGGSSNAASSFFLPLPAIINALKLIRNNQPVPRGSILTIFDYKPFSGLRELKLNKKYEKLVRTQYPEAKGMLTVSRIIPETSAAEVLKSGDILYKINGKTILDFYSLEPELNAFSGRNVSVSFFRGGELKVQSLPVINLHNTVPRELIEIGGSVFHNLSLHQAFHLQHPMNRPFVAHPGFMLGQSQVPRGAMVTSMAGSVPQTVDDLYKTLSTLNEETLYRLTYKHYSSPSRTTAAFFKLDTVWNPAKRCVREGIYGNWTCRSLSMETVKEKPSVFDISYPRGSSPLNHQLLMVEFRLPYSVEGLNSYQTPSYIGTGVIADAKEGLVIVDRNTVPTSMGEVTLTFGGSVQIPGKVVFIHPVHNLALVDYDPALLGKSQVVSAVLKDSPVSLNDSLTIAGLDGSYRLRTEEVSVAAVQAMRSSGVNSFVFHDSNLDVLKTKTTPTLTDGVMLNESMEVVALWSSFGFHQAGKFTQISRGIPSKHLLDTLSLFKNNVPYRSLGLQLETVPLYRLKAMGVPDNVLKALAKIPSYERQQALFVSGTVRGSEGEKLFRPGDIILMVNGHYVSGFTEFETLTQEEQVTIKIWRNQQSEEIAVNTSPLNGEGLQRVLIWQGAVIHKPHRAISANRNIPGDGLFIAAVIPGSFAVSSKIRPRQRILEINGVEVATIADFLAELRSVKDKKSVTILVEDTALVQKLLPVRLNQDQTNTYVFNNNNGQWKRSHAY